MKTIVPLTAIAAIALGLGACTPPKDAYGHWGKQAKLMKAVSRLDCPDEKGDLERVSIAPDGRSCIYRGRHESTIELKLVNLSGGDADTALAGLEAEARTLVPVNASNAGDEPDAATPPQAPQAPGTPAVPAAPAAPKGDATPTNVSMHPAGAKLPNGRSREDLHFGDHENVQIDFPGIHIHTNNNKANVKVAGVNIDADDDNDRVNVEHKAKGGVGGDLVFHADNGGAVTRVSNNDANIRTRLVLESEASGPQGDHAAGFVARGPRKGPLVVAVVRVKGEYYNNHDGIFADAGRLVRHNTDN